MKTLIITESYDTTTDLLIDIIGSKKIFRFNFDLYNDYKFKINSDGLLLESEHQKIEDWDIKKVFWRKPFINNLKKSEVTGDYVNQEIKYIFRELFNYSSLLNKTILVKPNYENYLGKITQMQIAKKYFNIPEWEISWNYDLNGENKIVKSLSSCDLNNQRILYTTKVNVKDLNTSYPWFIQNYIPCEKDITIVHIDGLNFPFELTKEDNEIDWRKKQQFVNQNWQRHSLPDFIDRSINSYMTDCGLKFGRLDFIYSRNEYHFLEVNPNGQWAWLDIDNKNGLLKEMAAHISPDTSRFALIRTTSP
jgi:hypothetical protein